MTATVPVAALTAVTDALLEYRAANIAEPMGNPFTVKWIVPLVFETLTGAGFQVVPADLVPDRLVPIIQDMAHELLRVERDCPCGARPETIESHPHAAGCPVAAALNIWENAFVRGEGG